MLLLLIDRACIRHIKHLYRISARANQLFSVGLEMEIVTVKDEAEVIATLWQHIERAATAAIAENNVFRIGLSGGSLVKYLAAGATTVKTDWSKWNLFFCDERYVEEQDAESTFGQYKQTFIPLTTLKAAQFLTIDTSIELADCAHAYEQEIYKRFDIQDVSFIEF